jgi:hypothetical protein
MKRKAPAYITVGIVAVMALLIVLKKNTSRNSGRERAREEQRDRNRRNVGGDTASPEKRRVQRDNDPAVDKRRETDRPPSDVPGRETDFDRRAGKLVFTKHARCRMACRHIDESEVQEILEQGSINERKSEPAARPDPKYALEGRTHDGQQVRIIFAPASRGMVVITVIDLDTDWTCDCK